MRSFGTKSSKATVNWLFAAVAMQGMMTGIFEHVIGMTTSANLGVLITWVVIVIIGLIRRDKYTVIVNNVILIGSIILAYCISKYIRGDCSYYTTMIIFYSLIPTFVSIQDVDPEKVLRYMIIISLFSVLYLDTMFSIQYEGFGQASMGNSYSATIPIIACMIHFRYYRKTVTKRFYILYAYDAYLLIRLIMAGNRGAILSLAVCFFVLLINNPDQSMNKIDEFKKNFKFIIVVILAIILFMNLADLLNLLSDQLRAHGINVPSFVDKSIQLLGMGDRNIDNGRSDLYEKIFTLIKRRPFLGYGMGKFLKISGYPWAHNFILQLWIDVGIIGALFAVVICVWYFKYLLIDKTRDNEKMIIAILLFCECIPRYLISNDPWRGVEVWMFFGFGLMMMLRKSEQKSRY